MRLESIHLHNFRQHRDLQLEFPKKDGHDLHVVIASNGVGKTNLMNAIHWCLYDQESYAPDSNKKLALCNLNAFLEAKARGKDAVEVSVKLRLTKEALAYEIERSTRVRIQGKFTTMSTLILRVFLQDGNTDILSGDEAREAVQSLLPEGISQYSFFDGEQLDTYFNDLGTPHIRNAINVMSQINVLQRADGHLQAVLSDYGSSLKKAHPELDNLMKEQKQLEANRASLAKDLDELKEDYQKAKKEIERLSAFIQGNASLVDVDHQRAEKQAELDHLQEEQEDAKTNLYRFLRDDYVRLMFYDVTKAAADYIEEKSAKKQLPPPVSKEIVEKSLHTQMCHLCGRPLDAATVQALEKTLAEYELSSSDATKLVEITNDVNHWKNSVFEYAKRKTAAFQHVKTCNDAIKETTDQIAVLTKKLSVVSSVEDLEEMVEQRANLEAAKERNNKKQGIYEVQIKALDEKIASKQREVEQAIQASEKMGLEEKCYQVATAARGIVDEVMQEISEEIRQTMEQATKRIFDGLTYKTKTFGDVVLSENYSLEILHKETGDSFLNALSAGERELLALAFTLAILEVSGYDSMLVIDTPVGRISDKNREDFAKSLVEISKERQMILLFTPDEFSENVQNEFTPARLASKCRILSRDEKESYVEVEIG